MKRYRAIAEYYDAENEASAMLQSDVPFFLSHLPTRRQSVLELAVGTARAAIPIAQSGHRVVGVDYAKDMLDIARRKRDAVGIKERDLELIQADVLDLDLGRAFDWICIFFNTFLGFTTLEDQDRLLEVVTRHLKPRGHLWLDIFNPDLRRLACRRSRGIDASVFYVPRYDRTVHRTVDIDRDLARQVQRITFRYQWFDKDGQKRRAKTTFDATFLMPRELRMLLERHDLRIEQMYGNYDGSKLSDDSPRMIAMCGRA